MFLSIQTNFLVQNTQIVQIKYIFLTFKSEGFFFLLLEGEPPGVSETCQHLLSSTWANEMSWILNHLSHAVQIKYPHHLKKNSIDNCFWFLS